MNMMDMMLKNLGVDPEEIKQQVQSFANATIELAETVRRLEIKIDHIETKLDALARRTGKEALTIEG